MTVAARPCPSCGRPELPPPSDVPPSSTLKAAMVEVLRFSQESQAIDPHHEYTIEEFVDWLALSCAEARSEPSGRPGRKVAAVQRRLTVQAG